MAAEGKWSGSSEVGYVTKYLWRGFNQSGESIQSSVTAVYSDKLTLGVVSTQGLNKDSSLDPTGNGKYGETDFAGMYSFSAERYSVTVGGTVYGIDDLIDPKTSERFKYYFESLASITLRTKFSPTLIFWREFGRLKTNYLEFSLSHAVELNKQWRLSFRPYAGVFEDSKHYFGADGSLIYEFGHQLYARATVTLIKNNYPLTQHERASFGVAAGLRW